MKREPACINCGQPKNGHAVIPYGMKVTYWCQLVPIPKPYRPEITEEEVSGDE